jgi:hypothetical protein
MALNQEMINVDGFAKMKPKFIGIGLVWQGKMAHNILKMASKREKRDASGWLR